MYSNEKKINSFFFYWLFLSRILVFLIIIVGGLTRLTDSGLSITEWEIIKGILPPLNAQTWNFYFNEYKKIPQFKYLNPDMTLDEFKFILLGIFTQNISKIIGLFFYSSSFFLFFKKIKIVI